jgi:hypothetical protein
MSDKKKMELLHRIDNIVNILRLGASPINEHNTVLYQDEHVCVLHPESPDGIVIYHHFPREFAGVINNEGLVLHNAKSDGRRTVDHPYHFFRTPAYYHGPQPVHPTLEAVNSNYASQIDPSLLDDEYFCIRIDPFKTYTYLSECRVVYFGTDSWRNSRMSLDAFWTLIRENSKRKGEKYHVFSGIKALGNGTDWVSHPPEHNAEILVSCDVIPPSWRVSPLKKIKKTFSLWRRT